MSLIDRMTAVSVVLPLVADVSDRPYDCGLCGREVQRSFLPFVADVSNRPYDCGLCGREVQRYFLALVVDGSSLSWTAAARNAGLSPLASADSDRLTNAVLPPHFSSVH